MSLFGFLKSSCARCGTTRGLHKISEGNWLCLQCLKEGEYKELWADIKTKISENYNLRKEENEAVYEKLIKDAELILDLKISFDNGEITKEEFEEKSIDFFDK